MILDPMEPAIDMLFEISLLRKLLKIRIQDKLFSNNALQMLNTDEALQFLLDSDKDLQSLANDLTQINGLLLEHLDHFIPTPMMWAQLQKY
jgi:signal transduction protein with GAF and PtsI domain